MPTESENENALPNPLGTDPLYTVLDELKKLSLSASKETFWEKYGMVLLPVFISLLIGIATFYTSYSVLEYKVVSVMEKHEAQANKFERLIADLANNSLADKEISTLLKTHNDDSDIMVNEIDRLRECVVSLKEKQAHYAAEYSSQKDLVNVKFTNINTRLNRLERMK